MIERDEARDRLNSEPGVSQFIPCLNIPKLTLEKYPPLSTHLRMESTFKKEKRL